jgi:hypothetical protein
MPPRWAGIAKYEREKVRGRVSKYVTNGSKTAVTEVIGLLCVSVGRRTIQLHDVADAHAHIQRLVSVVKMVTVLEVCTAEEQHSVMCFFVGKMTQRKGYS